MKSYEDFLAEVRAAKVDDRGCRLIYQTEQHGADHVRDFDDLDAALAAVPADAFDFVIFRYPRRSSGRSTLAFGGTSYVRLKLTEPQRSALECSHLAEDPEPEELSLLGAWELDPNELHFMKADRDEIAAALTELANCEDGQAEALGDRAARGACVALTNLAAKVLRSC